MAEPEAGFKDGVVQLVLDEAEEPWPVGGTKIVNDERPVEDLVEVTTIVDRVVVHVDDDGPEPSVPEVVLVPACVCEIPTTVGSVDDPSMAVHDDDTELAVGHGVISESEAV